MDNLPVPPSNEIAEKSLLCSILQEPHEYMPRAIDAGIVRESFYIPSNGTVFQIALDRINAGKDLDPVGFTTDLMNNGILNEIGGPGALTELFYFNPTNAHFNDRLKDVLDKQMLRKIIRNCTETITKAYEGGEAKEILQRYELDALSVAIEQQDQSEHKTGIKDVLKKLMDHLQSPEKPGIPTGIRALDEVTGGLHKKEIFIFAARPAVGKTSIGCTMIANMAIQGDVSAAYFASEGTDISLVGRIASAECGISQGLIRNKLVQTGDIAKLMKLGQRVQNSKIEIDDRVSSAVEIAARIRRMHQRNPLDVVIIDYIQKLLPSSANERDDPKALVRNSTNILHETCKRLNIALVILAQLSRQKTDLDPQMHHLADSSSLEKDGDVIVLAANKENMPDDPTSVRETLFRVAKNRHGPTADLSITFNPNLTKFY